MQIDLLGIQAFLAVAECGSFQLAAAQLHLSQTAVSHRLRKLEENLGVRLVARTTRDVSLTDAGRAFLPRARAAVADLALSCQAVRDHARGSEASVAFACLPTMAAAVLTPAIAAFAARWPATHLRIFDDSIEDIAERVESRSAAFGIGVQQPLRGELQQEHLLDEPFVLVCRADHPLAREGTVPWTRLAGEPLVRISLPFDSALTIEDALGPLRDRLQWRFGTQRHAMALQMVRAGLGITVVPRLNVGAAPDLAIVRLAAPSIHRSLVVVRRADRQFDEQEEDLYRRVRTALLELVPAAQSGA